MEVAAVAIAIVFYLGFMQFLQHQRRALVHKERLAAIEKGLPLPPEASASFSPEADGRRSWSVQGGMAAHGQLDRARECVGGRASQLEAVGAQKLVVVQEVRVRRWRHVDEPL
jgi:hypothetical protein